MPQPQWCKVAAEIERQTELGRYLRISRALQEDLAMISFHHGATHDLVSVVMVSCLIYFVYLYVTSPVASWKRLTTSWVAIGILRLFTSIIHGGYRKSLTDSYRYVER